MDYGRFTAEGAPHWQATTRLLDRLGRRRKGLDLDELDALAQGHRRVMGDYAVARTHFPGTAVTARLQRLAFRGHRALARIEAPWTRRLWRFLVHDYPAIFRAASGPLTVALAIFCGATLLGIVLAGVDPGFAEIFVGADAMAGMRRGEIWTDEVGHLVPPALLSSQIFTNIMSVALVACGGGALLGLGTLYLLVMNGVMFGSVLSLAAHYDLFDRLLAWIAAHGPLELFLIVVASAAGFQIAWGQLRWANQSRRESFAAAARQAVRLVGGTLPWFVLLGLVEGNVSPLMELATSAKAVLGLALLGMFLAYTRLPGPPPPAAP